MKSMHRKEHGKAAATENTSLQEWGITPQFGNGSIRHYHFVHNL